MELSRFLVLIMNRAQLPGTWYLPNVINALLHKNLERCAKKKVKGIILVMYIRDDIIVSLFWRPKYHFLIKVRKLRCHFTFPDLSARVNENYINAMAVVYSPIKRAR